MIRLRSTHSVACFAFSIGVGLSAAACGTGSNPPGGGAGSGTTASDGAAGSAGAAAPGADAAGGTTVMGSAGSVSATSNAGGAANGAASGANAGAATGSATAGSASGPALELPPLVTSAPGAYWKTDGALADATAERAVTVDDATVGQTWDGFGGAFNELGWSFLTTVELQQQAMKLLFSAEDGANFAWGRIPIGASDYAGA